MQRSLENKNLTLALIVTLIPTLFFPTFFFHLPIMFFAPFLIILYYQKSYLTSLWGSLLCGLVLDLLAAHLHIGLHAISYCLATTILYKQRRNFFADSLTTLPIMTFFFSVISTVFQLGLMYTFGQGVKVSGYWIVTDLIYMPILDALYAYCCFVLPALCFGRRQRRGKDYFMPR
jgi:rod shape-determining protein MreD